MTYDLYSRYESWRVNASLVLMILGALVAAMWATHILLYLLAPPYRNDITFDTLGYVFVFLNNVTTAASSKQLS